MKGCRAFDDNEFVAILAWLGSHGSMRKRNALLFLMGCQMGPRISELLALKLGDLVENGEIKTDVLLSKRLRKMKPESMWLPVTKAIRSAGNQWVAQMVGLGWSGKDDFLFQALETGKKKAVRPETVRRILKRAATACGITGRISTHSMRKTFARKVYEQTLKRKKEGNPMDPILETMQALGHKDPKNTIYYLGLSGIHTRDIIMEAWENEA